MVTRTLKGNEKAVRVGGEFEFSAEVLLQCIRINGGVTEVRGALLGRLIN